MYYESEAFKNCIYQSQIESKRYRKIDKTLGAYFKTEELYREMHKKHFKKTCAGIPTKRYLRILKQIEQAERIDYRDIELALTS